MNYKEKLNSILAKSPDELSQEKVDYLRSRQGYLSDDEKQKFKDILNPQSPSVLPGGIPIHPEAEQIAKTDKLSIPKSKKKTASTAKKPKRRK